jgi:transcriptional regulator with XRE-family HTH domain
MNIGQRLRELRESRKMSQGDIEKATGLFRCYTSRVENGHTVPSLGNLERYAAALDVPFYQLFHEGDGPPLTLLARELKRLQPLTRKKTKQGAEARFLLKLGRLLPRITQRHRDLLLEVAERLAAHLPSRAKAPRKGS